MSVTQLFFFNHVYLTVLHSMLVLLQASALNVAFNSHNKALLTILISNNVSIITSLLLK